MTGRPLSSLVAGRVAAGRYRWTREERAQTLCCSPAGHSRDRREVCIFSSPPEGFRAIPCPCPGDTRPYALPLGSRLPLRSLSISNVPLRLVANTT